MTSSCIHGFAPGTCLICQTLDGPRAKVAGTKKRSESLAPAASVRPSRTRTGPRVVPKEAPGTSTSAVVKLVVVAVAVVAVIVVAWTVLHIVFAVLHLIELVGVALVAGYLGWLAGVHHGHRSARRP